MKTVFERVKRVIVDAIDPDDQPGIGEKDVVPSAKLGEGGLRFDSMGQIDLLLAIEEAFARDGKPLEIPDEMLDGIKTVQDIVVRLMKLGFTDE